MTKLILTIVFILSAMAAKCQEGSPVDDIKSILQLQTESWNKGDFEGFMKGYWESDSLMYIGSSGIKYGWKTTLDSYRKGYPDESTRGKLQFDLLEFVPLAHDCYFVVGKWSLTRSAGDVSGHFSLVWKIIDSEWVIIADHSS